MVPAVAPIELCHSSYSSNVDVSNKMLSRVDSNPLESGSHNASYGHCCALARSGFGNQRTTSPHAGTNEPPMLATAALEIFFARRLLSGRFHALWPNRLSASAPAC